MIPSAWVPVCLLTCFRSLEYGKGDGTYVHALGNITWDCNMVFLEGSPNWLWRSRACHELPCGGSHMMRNWEELLTEVCLTASVVMLPTVTWPWKRIFFPRRNSKWDCSPGQHLGWSFQMRLWSGEPSKVRPGILVHRIMVCVLNRVPLFVTPTGSSVHGIFQARILERNNTNMLF